MSRISKEERIEVYAGVKDALKCFPPEERNEIYDALLWFILEGDESNVSGKAKSVLCLLKPYLIKDQHT